ncbi:hypothetical protein FJY68_11325 [candidate division WOR-3 bacterium]|uniref:Uncharacterized protein n=1 Tax=candidate division WOR-3 bacterium TaxID=2052148 RepID=A0A937XFE3_UNCW3|nr:hypothetical protein [candidate division WOR-3 bacterium]
MEDVVKVVARQASNLHLRDDGYWWSVYRHNSVSPTNYVVDTAGVVTYWSEGFDEMAIRGAIEALLPAPGPAAAAPTGRFRN